MAGKRHLAALARPASSLARFSAACIRFISVMSTWGLLGGAVDAALLGDAQPVALLQRDPAQR